MKLKHKHFAIHEFKADDESRTVEGWASTFGNKDAGSDIILPGAFTASLKNRMPKMLWQHDTNELIGLWTVAQETDRGLYVKGTFADTPRGNEAYTLAKMGALDSMSIGYSTLDYEWDPKTNTRTLKELELWEVSLVTFPMNEQATITNVKAASGDIDAACELLDQAGGLCDAYAAGDMQPTPETLGTVGQLVRQAMTLLDSDDEPEGDKSKKLTPKQIERILREAGMTRGDARGVLAKGYTAAFAEAREATGGEPELQQLFNQFKP
jgi:hypothetical protein